MMTIGKQSDSQVYGRDGMVTWTHHRSPLFIFSVDSERDEGNVGATSLTFPMNEEREVSVTARKQKIAQRGRRRTMQCSGAG